jgi:hypothetical protein
LASASSLNWRRCGALRHDPHRHQLRRLRRDLRHAPAVEASATQQGERRVWLEEVWVNRFGAMRKPGESYFRRHSKGAARMFTKLLTTAGVLASLSAYAAELPPMTFMCGSEYAGDPQYTKAVTVRDRMLTVTGGGMTESDPITESDTLYAISIERGVARTSRANHGVARSAAKTASQTLNARRPEPSPVWRWSHQ